MNKVSTIKTLAGVEMPQLIYGTAWKKERTKDLVVLAVKSGFNAIDTACQPRHYREDLVGAAISELNEHHGIVREELYIQTKFTSVDGQDPDNIPYDPDAPLKEQVEQSFSQSLKNLGTAYVDSLVLHSPLGTFESTIEVWNAMEQIYNNKGCRQLGISNCYWIPVIEQLWNESNIKPSVLQNRFCDDTGHDKDLRDWCNKAGIKYQSFWTLTANPDILKHETVKQLASKHKKSEPQIFFRYLTQRGISPLTGTCNETHMREDLEIFNFSLAEDELNFVDDLI